MKKSISIFLIITYLLSIIKVPIAVTQSTDNFSDEDVKKILSKGAIFCVKDAVEVSKDVYKVVCLISPKNLTKVKFEFGPAFSFGRMEFLGYEATDKIEFVSKFKNFLEFEVFPTSRVGFTINIKANFRPNFKVTSTLPAYYFNDLKELFDAIDSIHSIEALEVLKSSCEVAFEKECVLEHFITNSSAPAKYINLTSDELSKLVALGEFSKKIDGADVKFVLSFENNEVKVYDKENYVGNFYLHSAFVPVKAPSLPETNLTSLETIKEVTLFFLNYELKINGTDVYITEYEDLDLLADEIFSGKLFPITGSFIATEIFNKIKEELLIKQSKQRDLAEKIHTFEKFATDYNVNIFKRIMIAILNEINNNIELGEIEEASQRITKLKNAVGEFSKNAVGEFKDYFQDLEKELTKIEETIKTDFKSALDYVRNLKEKITSETINDFLQVAKSKGVDISKKFTEKDGRRAPKVVNVVRTSVTELPPSIKDKITSPIFVPKGQPDLKDMKKFFKELAFRDYIDQGIYLFWGDYSKVPREYLQVYVSVAKEDYQKALKFIQFELKRNNIPHLMVKPELYDEVKNGKYVIILLRNNDDLRVVRTIEDILYNLNIRPGPKPLIKGISLDKYIISKYTFGAWENNFGGEKKIKPILAYNSDTGKLETISPETPLLPKVVTQSDLLNKNFKEGDVIAYFAPHGDARIYLMGEIKSFDASKKRVLVSNIFGSEFEIPINWVSNTPNIHIFYDKHKQIEIRQLSEKLWRNSLSKNLASKLSISDVELLLKNGFYLKGDLVYYLSEDKRIYSLPLDDFLKSPSIEDIFWDTYKNHLIVIPNSLSEKYPARLKGLAITKSVYNDITSWINNIQPGQQKGLVAFLTMNEKGVIDKVWLKGITDPVYEGVTLGSIQDFHKYILAKYLNPLEFGLHGKLLAYFVPEGFLPDLTLGQLLASFEYDKKDVFHLLLISRELGEVKFNFYRIDFSKLSKDDIQWLKYIANEYRRRTGTELALSTISEQLEAHPDLKAYFEKHSNFHKIGTQNIEMVHKIDETKAFKIALLNGEQAIGGLERSLKNLKKMIFFGNELDLQTGFTYRYSFRYASNIYTEIRRRVDLWDSILDNLLKSGEISQEIYNSYKNIINKVYEIGLTIEPGKPIKDTLKKIDEALKSIKNEKKTLFKLLSYQSKKLSIEPNTGFSEVAKNIEPTKLPENIEESIENSAIAKVAKEEAEKGIKEIPSQEEILQKIEREQERLISETPRTSFEPTAQKIGKVDELTSKIDNYILSSKIADSLTTENIRKLLDGKVVFVDDNYLLVLSPKGQLTLVHFPDKTFLYSSDGTKAVIKMRSTPYLTPDDLDELIKKNIPMVYPKYKLPDEVLVIGIVDGRPVEKLYDLREFKKFVENEGTPSAKISREFREKFNSYLDSIRGTEEEVVKALDKFFNMKGLPEKSDLTIAAGPAVKVKPKLLNIDEDYLQFRLGISIINAETAQNVLSPIYAIRDDLETNFKLMGIKTPDDIADGMTIKIKGRDYVLRKLPNNQISIELAVFREGDPSLLEFQKVGTFYLVDGEVKDAYSWNRAVASTFKDVKASQDLRDGRYILNTNNYKIEKMDYGSVVFENNRPAIFSIVGANRETMYVPISIDRSQFLQKTFSEIGTAGIGKEYAFGSDNGDVYRFTKRHWEPDLKWEMEVNGKPAGFLTDEGLKTKIRELVGSGYNPLIPAYRFSPIDVEKEIRGLSEPYYSKTFSNGQEAFRLRNVDGRIILETGGMQPRTITVEEARSLLATSKRVEILSTDGANLISQTSFWKQISRPVGILTKDFYPLVGPADFIAFGAIAAFSLYSITENREEMNRRIVYNTVENFAVEPLLVTTIARGLGLRAAFSGARAAVAGVGGAITLGILTAVVAAEMVAEDTIEEYLRGNRLNDMGIPIPNDLGSALGRVFGGYWDFLINSNSEQTLESSSMFNTVATSIYKDLSNQALKNFQNYIDSKIGNKNNEILKGIQKIIELHGTGPKGNYVDIIDGTEYVWFMEEGKFEVKYTNEAGNKVTITYRITDAGIVPTEYKEEGKVGFDALGCLTRPLGLGGNCCLNLAGCDVGIIEERKISFSDLQHEAFNRADDLIVDRVEGDLNRLTAFTKPDEILNEAQRIADKLNSDPNFVQYYGRPITASEVIELAKPKIKKDAETECLQAFAGDIYGFSSQEAYDKCVEDTYKKKVQAFEESHNQIGFKDCSQAGGTCMPPIHAVERGCERFYFYCDSSRMCCKSQVSTPQEPKGQETINTYEACEGLRNQGLDSGCYLGKCGQGYISAGYCDKANDVYCCVKAEGTGQINTYEACEGLRNQGLDSGCHLEKCIQGYTSVGYCDQANSVHCCVKTEDCTSKELKKECISDKKLRITGYVCPSGYGSDINCLKCVEGSAEIECKMGCSTKTNNCVEENFVPIGNYICPKDACSKSGEFWTCDLGRCEALQGSSAPTAPTSE
ncbi:MAG: hypothetical protein QXQ18_00215 [Candidatus Aenigmatarchaeota archaeon]